MMNMYCTYSCEYAPIHSSLLVPEWTVYVSLGYRVIKNRVYAKTSKSPRCRLVGKIGLFACKIEKSLTASGHGLQAATEGVGVYQNWASISLAYSCYDLEQRVVEKSSLTNDFKNDFSSSALSFLVCRALLHAQGCVFMAHRRPPWTPSAAVYCDRYSHMGSILYSNSLAIYMVNSIN